MSVSSAIAGNITKAVAGMSDNVADNLADDVAKAVAGMSDNVADNLADDVAKAVAGVSDNVADNLTDDVARTLGADTLALSGKAPKLKPTKAKKAIDRAILREAAPGNPIAYASLYGVEFKPTNNPVVHDFSLTKAIVKGGRELTGKALHFLEVTGIYSTKTNTVHKLKWAELLEKARP